MGYIKLFRIRILCIGFLFILQVVLYAGCDQKSNSGLTASNAPEGTAESHIQVKVGEKDEYGGIVIAVDKFDNNYSLEGLRSISKDGRYYLFQQAQHDKKTHEPSEKSKLILWDNIDMKTVNSIEGKIAAGYMRNSILDMENKGVYYDDMHSIYYIDFKQKEIVDILHKYKIEPGNEYIDEFGNPRYYVGFLAFDNGTLFVSVRTEKDRDNPVCSMYQIKDEKCKKINIDINERIAFMEILGTIEGSRLMLRINSKFYITDYNGNVIEERPLIKNKDFETLGSVYMYPSYDGKRLIYALGNMPTDLYMYNFKTKEVKVLCPGGRNSAGMNIPSIREKYGESYGAFWTGNGKVIALIALGDVFFGGTRTVAAKEYTIE